MTGMQFCYFQTIEVLEAYWNSTCKTDTSTNKTAVAEPGGSTTQVRKPISDHFSTNKKKKTFIKQTFKL